MHGKQSKGVITARGAAAPRAIHGTAPTGRHQTQQEASQPVHVLQQ